MPSRTAPRRKTTPAAPAIAPAGAEPWARLIPWLLIGSTLAALWPVCLNDFTTWDDYANVARNPLLNPVSFEGVWYFWQHAHMSIYIPLTYSVWGVLAAIGRLPTADAAGISLNPWIFHTANLLVHVSAVLLAYQMLKTLSHRSWPAAAGALLFALHPMQVEPVAWVAGLKDVLCGALALAALWQYVLFARQTMGDPSSPRLRWLHYAAATASFVLAMLAKPSAMTVPLAALLIDRFMVHRPWRAIAMALAPWLALAAGCAVVAKISQPVHDLPGTGSGWERLLLAGDALSFYLHKLIWPARLAVQYHHSPEVVMANRWVWFAWIVPVALAVVAWFNRGRRPWLLVGAGLMVTATLPVLGLVPFQFERLSLVADHYMYLGMIGPALVLAFALASMRHARLATGVCAACFLALSIRSYFQAWHWRDTMTLFQHELTVNPNSEVAYNSLAAQAIIARNAPLAEQLARESIRLQPKQEDAYITLGSALHMQRRLDEALIAYRRAYEMDPENSASLDGLAGLLADRGQIDQAMPLCRRAIELDPFSASAHRNLAVMLATKGQIPDALREMQTALQLAPDDPEAQTGLAFLLARMGRRAEAIQHLQETIAAHPDFSKAQQLLGELTRH